MLLSRISLMKAFVMGIVLSYVFAEFGQAQRTISIDPDSYAAVAVSESTGKYSYAYNYRSRRSAEKEALKQCDAPDAKIACWINLGFIALARSDEKSCWGVGWVYGRSVRSRDAMDMALKNVDKYCTNPSGAYIALALSSDGQMIVEQRDKNTIVDQDGNVHEGRIGGPAGGTMTVITKDGNVYKYDAQGRPITLSPAPSASKSSILGKAAAEAGKN